MAQEQTFRSPNFYDREVDLSAPVAVVPSGIPAGVIGTSRKGPAFVPVTLANYDEFVSIFGGLDTKMFGPYAVNEFLKNRSALTYMRVLGAGGNVTVTDMSTTSLKGTVTNAGFSMIGALATHDSRGRHDGAVQFIVAKHTLQTSEAYGMPMFTDNTSYGATTAQLVRGIVMVATGARLMVLDGNESAVGAFTADGPDDGATLVGGKFKLVISSTLGNAYYNTDNNPGIRIMTASLDPTSADYIGKVLKRDPDRFVQDMHYLHADFAVDDELATPTVVGVLSGSASTSSVSGDTTLPFRKVFGAYNTRYTTPASPMFISQPFGTTEYELFKFEALDDGEYANKLYKIAIKNLKASLDDSYPYGTFTVQIRDWNDNDLNPTPLEEFHNCSLDPNSDTYIAKLIGDRKVTFNFDAVDENERRIVMSGKYKNMSKLVRVLPTTAVEKATIPARSLPFGFKGIETIKTNDSLNDTVPTTAALSRFGGCLGVDTQLTLSGAIVPPIPFRYKITKGAIPSSTTWDGQPGQNEMASSQFYWGVKFERCTTPLNTNIESEKNAIVDAYTKFVGIKKLDALVTGSGADTFNNNKFSLSKVALSAVSLTSLTGTLKEHMREAAYIRDGVVDGTNYTITDALGKRVTFATILANDTAANFNKFAQYAKFVTFMGGGFDGLNFLDLNARRMNDKSTSFDTGGGAEANYVSPGMLSNMNGAGQANSNVISYKTAIDIMTDGMIVNHNVILIPGIRETFLTDYAMSKTKDYGLAYYIMDIPSYDDDSGRLYDDSTARPNVDQTAAQLDTRAIDNNYAGTYFPSVYIDDLTNKRRVKVPASIAAIGAIGFNDRVKYPWYAPAGFNRASLDFVTNVDVRLNVSDRDRLYDSRINPIATFPRLKYVIYGQKTLQIAKSSLDRVNVRRLMLEVKRIVVDIVRKEMFDNITPALRNKFVADVVIQLALIQSQQGIERCKVICNETNNTAEDVQLNRMNGRIVVIPTKTIENIAVDFIITNNNVMFV
jgi:hypothetical protein